MLPVIGKRTAVSGFVRRADFDYIGKGAASRVFACGKAGDGVNVKDYTLEALNNKLGYVSQKAVMFNGSVNFIEFVFDVKKTDPTQKLPFNFIINLIHN